jgi:hypothetical protein
LNEDRVVNGGTEKSNEFGEECESKINDWKQNDD